MNVSQSDKNGVKVAVVTLVACYCFSFLILRCVARRSGKLELRDGSGYWAALVFPDGRIKTFIPVMNCIYLPILKIEGVVTGTKMVTFEVRGFDLITRRLNIGLDVSRKRIR